MSQVHDSVYRPLDAHIRTRKDCQLDKQGSLIGILRLGVGSEWLSSTEHHDWCGHLIMTRSLLVHAEQEHILIGP